MPRNPWLAVMALLLIGVYAPTSYDTVISIQLHFVNLAVLLLLLLVLAIRRNGICGGLPLVCSLAIPALLIVFTLLSPFTEFAYGAMLTYALLAIVLALRLRDLTLPAFFPRVVLAVSLVNVAAAGCLLFQLPEARDFLLDYYSASYPELVQLMLDEGKPVLSFASHSIAGFYFYLFFFLNLETYRTRGGGLHLAAAICHVLMMITLTSYTGYLFGAAGLLQLIHHFVWNRSLLKGLAAGFALLVTTAGLAATFDLRDVNEALIDRVLNAESSGINGRYSSSGALAGNLTYIANNPFQPIGLGYSLNLFYGDSGPVEYMTRGSFPLVIAIYGGLFFFLRANLGRSPLSIWVMLVYLAFEAGYSNLNYFRSLYLLPVVVVYLNNLRRDARC